MSVISAFTSYSTTPTWVTNPYLTAIKPTDDTPYTTYTLDESWQELPDLPNYCVAVWMIHAQGRELGPCWYIFCLPNCPEDDSAYNMYEEFDDWEYIPNPAVYKWSVDPVPNFLPAVLNAREDPLEYFAYTNSDPNNWVNDIIQAVHMTIYTMSSWDEELEFAWPKPQKNRWGKPNRHVRRKMGLEWAREQDQFYEWTWQRSSSPVELGPPDWEVTNSSNVWE